MSQLVVPHMAAKRTGLIINIGSVVGSSLHSIIMSESNSLSRAGIIPTPWTSVYSSSKAALHSWSDALRMEVKGLGVNVMLVAPGAITSGFGKKQLNSFAAPKGASP